MWSKATPNCSAAQLVGAPWVRIDVGDHEFQRHCPASLAKDVTFELNYAVVYNDGGGYWIFPANEVQTSRRA